MCRLYGFRATEPTKIECPLVLAQNALMDQSRQNMTGLSHAHGWGVTIYKDGLPRLEKQGRVKQERLDKWAVRVRTENFATAADGDAVLAEWRSLPKRLRNDVSVLEAYYEALMRVGLHDKAEKDLSAALKAEWRMPLVRLYGRVEGPDPTRQLKRAEHETCERELLDPGIRQENADGQFSNQYQDHGHR